MRSNAAERPAPEPAAWPRRHVATALGLGAVILMAGCVAYPVNPYPPPSAYNRAWDAAAGALLDQGVSVKFENRETGIMQGSRGGISVTATLRMQDDGRVRVQFDTSGNTAGDPTLIERITSSYNARMGR